MPVNIPPDLPARQILEAENIFVMTCERAVHQDIRPLRLAILNLMPTKIATETHLLRLLGNTPLQVQVTLLRMGSHESKNTEAQHLEAFYATFDEVRQQRFDGLVITGAPVELLEFEEVDYWPELCELLDWSRTHVYSTVHVCWGAQAALYRRYGVQKHELPQKCHGVFRHDVLDRHDPLLFGFDDGFPAPHSRHTDVRAEDVAAVPGLKLLATAPDAGLFIAASEDRREVFITGHPEYDRDTIAQEYRRDQSRGVPTTIPTNYFPDDDPSREPQMTWRSHASLLYANWLNHYVYQGTPYDFVDPRPQVTTIE